MSTSTTEERTRPATARQASPSAARPVSAAVERGGAALYAAAAPRGAAPWHRRSHLFQGIYIERSAVVLAAAVNVDELAQAIRTIDGNHTMGAGDLAEKLHAFLLGGAA